MELTTIRETVFFIGHRKVPAWVAHHHCGWSTKMIVGSKKLKAKGWTNTPGYVFAKKKLSIHRLICERRERNLADQPSISSFPH